MIRALALIVACSGVVRALPPFCSSYDYYEMNDPLCQYNGCGNNMCGQAYCNANCNMIGKCFYVTMDGSWELCTEETPCISSPGSYCYLATATPCPAGKYSNIANVIKCQDCAAGTYSLPGASACSACTICSTGSYMASACIASANTVCIQCPAGQFINADATGCETCPAGTYSTPGATACTACPANFWSVSGAACTANAGYYDIGSSMLAYYCCQCG